MVRLYVQESVGVYREATQGDVMACANDLIDRQFRKGAPVLSTPAQTKDYLRLHLGTREQEVFGLIYLNSRHRLIAIEDLFRGGLDGASVFPREVVKAALARNAHSVICYHNHPSGVSDPSAADEMVTRRLKQALELVEVRLLDHLIVGDLVYSFSEAGRL